MTAWHWLVHITGCDYGFAYGHFSWYDMYSGVGGSYLVAGLAFLAGWYFTHTCHDHLTCLRWGKYAAAGGIFKVCRHHHPDLRGQRPHGALIERLHQEWKQQSQ